MKFDFVLSLSTDNSGRVCLPGRPVCTLIRLSKIFIYVCNNLVKDERSRQHTL